MEISGRPTTGDAARAAGVNPVSVSEAKNRAATDSLGDGTVKLTTAFAAYAKKGEIDRDQIESVKQEGQVLAGIDDDKSKLDPMAPDYADRVREIIKTRTEGAAADARFRTREVQDEFTRRMARIGATVELTAQADRRKSIEEEGLRVYKERLDALYGQIRKDPAGADAYMEAFKADAARLSSGIAPDKLRAVAGVAADGMLAARVEGYAQRGDFASAKAFLDKNAGSFTPEANRSLRGMIRGEEERARADAARYQASQLSDFYVGLSERTRREDFNPVAERQKVEAMYKEGKISPAARAAAVEHIFDAEDKMRKVQGVTMDALDRYNAGRGFDSEKQAGAAFAALTKDKPITMELLTEFTAKGGQLPPQIKDLFETADKGGISGDPNSEARLVQAATFYASLSDQVPGVMSKLATPRLDAVVAEARRNGGTPEAFQAAAKRILSTPQAAKDLEDRGKTFDALTKPETYTSLAKDVFGTGTFAKNAVIPGEVAMELQRLAKQAYLDTNNMDTAKEVAKKNIAKHFQTTYVGGVPTVTRNAIEWAFPKDYQSVAIEDRARIVNMEVKAQLDAAKIETQGDKDNPGFRLSYAGVQKRADGSDAPAWTLEVMRKGDTAYTRIIQDGRPYLVYAPKEGTAANSPLVKEIIQRNRDEEAARRSAREAREKKK